MLDLNALQDLLTATEALTDDQRREIYAAVQEGGSLTPEHMALLRKATTDQATALIAEFDETAAAEAELALAAQDEQAQLQPVAAALAQETTDAMNTAAEEHVQTLREIERGLDDEVRYNLAAQDAAAADVIRQQLKAKDA